MKRIFDFIVQVVYNGSVKIEAENLPDAEQRVRELVQHNGTCHSLLGENESYEFDSRPAVHFLHHSEIPNTETPLSHPPTQEELNTGKRSWCQTCTNQGCCLHGTDSPVPYCSNYKDKEE